MKNITYLFASACVALGLASCDIDNVENMGELSTENFPVSEADGIAALAGVYQNLNATHAYPQESFIYYAQLASDDALGGGGTNDKLMQAMDLITNYNADMTNNFWVLRYEGINRANTLITALPNTAMDEEIKKQFLGEALFLRAYYHFDLASMYGNVPLMTVPSGELVTQGDVAVLYGQMLQDLRDAVEMMSATRKTDGHVDKYTAEALMARIFLFYTGMYGNGTDMAALTSTTYKPLTSVALPDGTTLTKENVIAYVDDCVNNSGYELVSDFRNLWAYTNRYTVEDYNYTKGKGLKWAEDDNAANPESMFAIKFNKLADWQTTIGYGNGVALHMGVRGGQSYDKTFPFGQGWGAGPVAPNLVNDWKSADRDEKDIRREATIVDWSKSTTYVKGGWADFVQETDYYSKKWSPISAINDGSQENLIPVKDNPYVCCFENLMYGASGWTQGANNMQLNNIHDLVLIRFADVLLMQSELKEDVAGINRVRARAGLAPIASYSLEALQNERRWELALEGIRWNDIRRWHIAAEALSKQDNQPVYYCGQPDRNTAHNGGYAVRYKATAGFQKMPESQVAIGSVVQNEGWTGADSEYTGWK
ncbi:RagB/SusD family nutrient uptake outer membrane protein [Bacteroides heparinolyticus]|uniref:RagB/SusD domain protein n=4 Tax=Prevotella heparinolytica TaxID=28113 RepID=A0A3P2A7Q5_9BACE|nr:RagB/SusD family nutrient uptake outer membrane protein [Bacteroides heparinolyticus]MCF0256551.1 RagB/SusD family nutrient uptake outer membrane protein [Bacteroides heparinolyticus]MCI6213776.1 RagB/SusD family nutrient uptake outer membrane protein [Bacteroides heparinolyticus]RRD91411.1 RagB/SusD family nutrient uptake outer membrane protein [Bacteroides heparinolyticus]VFB14431.1 RagB/SusD domain protein [Bacteroides heparinolyticus]